MNVFTLPGQHKPHISLVSKHVQGPKPALSPVEGSKVQNQENQTPTLNPQSLAPLLVGRGSELTYLCRLLDKALHGERQVVFVTGEAGIGKTTLVDAFLAQIRDRTEVRITSGQCVELYGSGEAYMPLLEATIQLCRGPSREQRIEDLKRYAPSWLVQLPGLLDPENRAFLQEGVQGTGRECMLREMAEAAELFTTRRGLVLVLEDLHWSDVSTLEWLSYMARRREPAKLLILGTYRPTDVLASGHPLRGVVQDLQSRRQCNEVRLGPLAKEAIAEYLAERFAVGVPLTSSLRDLAPLLVRRTGGNPLFVVNTVDYFVRQGAVTEEAGQWTLQTDKVHEVGDGIPDTLRQLIERQVERLSEAEQRLLEVASVAGVEFTSVDVAAGLSTTVEEVEARCERFAHAGQWLRSVGFTESPDGTVSGRYSFLHAMYHEVIYGRIAEIRRIQLHRRIGARKESAYGERVGEIAAELAVHFEKGRELTRAVHYLGKAGKTAVQRSAHLEAISHLNKGLDLLTTFPETPERAQQELQLCLTLGTSLMVIKGYAAPELEGLYARARALYQQVKETPQLPSVLGGLWAFYATRARLQTARGLAEQYLTVAGERQRPTSFLWAHSLMGQTLYGLGELRESQTHLEQSLRLYNPLKHSPRVATSPQDPGETSLAYLARVLWLLGYPEQALKKSDEACHLAQNLGHPYSLAHALSLAASLHQLRGEVSAARTQAEAAIALLTESGSPYRLAQGTILWGWTLTEQGEREEGIAQMLHGLTAWQASGAELWRPYYLSLLAEVHLKANQLDEGQRVVAEALQLVETREEQVHDAELYRLKGTLTLQSQASLRQVKTGQDKSEDTDPRPLPPDPRGEAEAHLLKAIDLARSQEAKSLELRAAMSLARLWQQQGKITEARELLEDIYNWFTEGFDTKDLRDAAALLSELGGSVRAKEERQKSKGKRQKAKIRTEDREHQRAGDRESGRRGDDKLIAHSPIRPFAPSFSQPQPPAPNTFHREGEYWTVSFAGTTCRLKDARGLHFIAHLLQHPHQEVHVITLSTVNADLNEELPEGHHVQDSSLSVDRTEGFSDAGEILDPQARAAYKRRLSELREELAEAQRFHDLGRSERLTNELDFLTHELASAVGLGGRARRVASPAERARVNITRAVKIALRKITEQHPALGRHLATTIKTGAYCSYTPDVRMPITWQGQ